jgi:8-oxo-dGTP pyrophosphatase MutT (NUDIX family)
MDFINNYTKSLSSIINDEFNPTTHIDNYDDLLKDEKKIKTYCSNCGKYGHVYKKCKEPITSLGIINLYLHDLKLDSLFSNKYVINNIATKYKQNNYHIKNIYLQKFNDKNNESLTCNDEIDKYIEIVKNKLKILMIRRKNTVGYIEFVRGRYDETKDDAIIFLLNQMTVSEINYLKTNTFDDIWHNLWNGKYNDLPLDENIINNLDLMNETQYQINLDKLSPKDKHIYIKVHLKEYGISKAKFDYIKENNIFERLNNNINIEYDQPEWGFPKGRRNLHEKNIDCALREFTEETGIDHNKIEVMDRIYPLNEIFIGTNNLNYKHSYYLSIGKMENLNLDLPSQKIEIGAIGWFTYDEAQHIIRPYHVNRLRLLDEIILFLAHNLKYYSNYNKVLLND